MPIDDSRLFMGRGGGGVRPGGQMAADIIGMSDPAIRAARQLAKEQTQAQETSAQQGLDAAFGDDPQAQVHSMSDILADMGVQRAVSKKSKKGLKNLDPVADREEYMKTLEAEVKRMNAAAKAVQASGTGNTKAYNTYMQVGAAYVDRLTRMQDEDSQALAQPEGE